MVMPPFDRRELGDFDSELINEADEYVGTRTERELFESAQTAAYLQERMDRDGPLDPDMRW